MPPLRERIDGFLREYINWLIALFIIATFISGFVSFYSMWRGYIREIFWADMFLLFWVLVTYLLFKVRDGLAGSEQDARSRRVPSGDATFDLAEAADTLDSPLRMGFFDREDHYHVVADIGGYRGPEMSVVATPYKVSVRTVIDRYDTGKGEPFENSVSFHEFVDPGRARAELMGELLHVHVPKDPDMWTVEDGGPRVPLVPVVRGGP